MGLFSFLKNAGSKLLGKDAEENEAEKSAARIAKINMLLSLVTESGIEIEGLSVELAEDVVTVYGQASSVSDKEKVVLLLGNVEGVATVDDRLSLLVEEPESDFYEVKGGDSLSRIAKKYYGNAMKYPVIFEANQPMLKSPDLIYPGQVLRIPKLK